MIKYLKKVSVFFIPITFVILIAETFLRKFETVYDLKLNGLLAKRDSIEVLLLGNSHACYGINPAQFSLYAFNLAQVNQSIYFDKRLTLKYLEELPKLKYVLVSVDFHSLYFSSQGVRDTWSYYSHGIEYNGEVTMLSKVSRIFGYTPRVAYTLIKRAWQTRNEEHRPVDLESRAERYYPNDNGWIYFEGTDGTAMNKEEYRSRAEVFNRTVRTSSERVENLEDLDDFIYQLKLRKIYPIIIQSPCYHEFKSLLNKEVLDQNESDIGILSKKYDIPYWKADAELFTSDDFFNCDHLNKNGANKYSAMLNSYLERLLPHN